MKRIGPSLLSIILAGILLASPFTEFHALGQTEASEKSTPTDTVTEETETDWNVKDDMEDKVILNEDIRNEYEKDEDTEGGDLLNGAAGDEHSTNEINSAEYTDGDSNKQLSSEADPTQDLLTDSNLTAISSNVPLEVTQVIAAGSKDVIAVELDRAKDTVSDLLTRNNYHSYVSAAVRLSDKSRTVCPIRYDLEPLSQAGPGLVLVPGSIVAPDGAYLPPELDTAVLPVFLYDPAFPVEMPAVDYELELDYILLNEADTEADFLHYQLINQNIWYDLENGYSWASKMSWDLSGVRFGTPGSYKAYAVSPITKGILLPADFPAISVDVVIQEDGKFTLGPPDFKSGCMEILWTKETPDISLLHSFYAVGDGDWQEDKGQLINLTTDWLYVYYYDVEYFDTPYYFKLSYNGEDSNILKVYMSEDQMYYNFYDGDRDGGDRDDQKPPVLGQPAPTEPSAGKPQSPDTSASDETPPAGIQPSDSSFDGNSNNSSAGNIDFSDGSSHTAGPGGSAVDGPGPTAPSDIEAEANPPMIVSDASAYGSENASFDAIEEETEDYVVLSGNRLKKLLEHNYGQPFMVTKHRIRLSIPTDTGLFSHMDSQSLFRVELLALSDNTFSVVLLMDGLPLTNIPPLTLSIPWEKDREDVYFSLTGADGTVFGNAQVQDDVLTFTVPQTGTFTIKKIPHPADSNTGSAVTVETYGSGNTDGLDGSNAAPADTPVSVPQEQTKAPNTSRVPILCAVLVLALLVLCFWCGMTHNRRKKGGGT